LVKELILLVFVTLLELLQIKPFSAVCNVPDVLPNNQSTALKTESLLEFKDKWWKNVVFRFINVGTQAF